MPPSYATLCNVYNEPWVFEAGTGMSVKGRNAQPRGIHEYRTDTS
jgi:hypothetical protein